MTSKLASALAFAIAIHAASFCRGESATPNNMMPTSISAAQWVYPGTKRADSPSNAFMRISFDAEWREVTPDEPSYSCAGVCMLVEYVDGKGRKIDRVELSDRQIAEIEELYAALKPYCKDFHLD